MTSIVTFTHSGVNLDGGVAKPVTIESAKVEWTADNKVTSIPIPSIGDTSEPNIALLNMKSFNVVWLITGYIVKKSTPYATPQLEKEALYEMMYKTGDGSGNTTQVNLTYRDETPSHKGYIKKISLNDSFSGDFSTLADGELAYEMQIMFIEGNDIANL